jgi:hypothetical protein
MKSFIGPLVILRLSECPSTECHLTVKRMTYIRMTSGRIIS